MIAEDVRRHYQRDVLILDVDENLGEDFAPVVSGMRGAPLALWQSGHGEKTASGVVEGLVFLSGSSDMAGRFAVAVRAYLRHRLMQREEFWGWDGHALRHGLALLTAEERGQILNLATYCPDVFSRFFPVDNNRLHREFMPEARLRQCLLQRLGRLFSLTANPLPFEWLNQIISGGEE